MAIGTGILALMTLKPGLAASLLTIISAIVVGVVASLRFGRRPALAEERERAMTQSKPELEGSAP